LQIIGDVFLPGNVVIIRSENFYTSQMSAFLENPRLRKLLMLSFLDSVIFTRIQKILQKIEFNQRTRRRSDDSEVLNNIAQF